jgi:hypothetical protein
MNGFVCRFCLSKFESDNGSVSLEISIGNQTSFISVCRECRSHIAGSRIIRCQSCGNSWLKADEMIDNGMCTVSYCTLCNSADMEDVSRIHDLIGKNHPTDRAA